MTRFHFERPDGMSGNSQLILEHLNEFVPPQGIGGITTPSPPLDRLIQVKYPPLADTDYQFYKFYQIKPGQITEENIGKTIRIEIHDFLGPGVFLEPGGFDLRPFDENNVQLEYEIINFEPSIGEFEIKVEIPNADNLTFIQLTFGNPTATEDSGTLGGTTFLELFTTPLLTKDVVQILVDNDGWFNLEWHSRIPLTVNPGQIPTEQHNIPLLISGIFPDLIGVSLAELRFTDSNRMQLDYEIQKFDNTTGELIAWVKHHLISDGNLVYIYYENPFAIDEQNPNAVWSDYEAVWHLNNNVVGLDTILDSTANPRNGTAENGVLSVPGKIGKALDFDGIDDGVSLGVVPLGDKLMMDSSDIAISFIVKPGYAGADNFQRIIAKSNGAGGGDDGWAVTIRNIAPAAILFLVDNNEAIRKCNALPNDTNFHHVVITKKHNDLEGELYVDGVPTSPTLGTTIIPNIQANMAIGRLASGADRFYDGLMEQVTVSKIMPNQDRVTTEFNNKMNPDLFFTISPKENLKVIEEVRV